MSSEHDTIGVFELEAALHRPIVVKKKKKYCERYRGKMAAYALQSLSLYFNVIQQSVCAVLLQVEQTWSTWQNNMRSKGSA